MNEKDYFDLIKTYKLIANKSLGQNFLINPEIAKSIVDKLEINEQDNVLEIGCGLGSLSYFLFQKCDATVIDVDEKMVNYLLEKFPNKNVVRQNILKMDISSFTKIVGNLPYYITTSIITKLLLEAHNAETFVLMTQKEVLQKLLDKNEVSPLKLLLNYVGKITYSSNVSKNNFTPIPHVDSSYFIIKTNELIKDDNTKLYSLMEKLFIHRRKTIFNNLSIMINNKDLAKEILSLSNINPLSRP